jgi:hypothetical protein
MLPLVWTMDTVAEYRHNAIECRKLSHVASNLEDKEALEQLARSWEKLAADRERELQS